MPDTVQVLANSREDVEANRAVLVHGKDGLQEHQQTGTSACGPTIE
ncbi:MULTISPECIES: hypothetical protein [Microbacterium]|nr:MULTISPECIES: hypothetical protein [Microbacterium]